jgi:hypothetical protein
MMLALAVALPWTSGARELRLAARLMTSGVTDAIAHLEAELDREPADVIRFDAKAKSLASQPPGDSEAARLIVQLARRHRPAPGDWTSAPARDDEPRESTEPNQTVSKMELGLCSELALETLAVRFRNQLGEAAEHHPHPIDDARA